MRILNSEFKKLNKEFTTTRVKLGSKSETMDLVNSLPEAYKVMKNALKYGIDSIKFRIC